MPEEQQRKNQLAEEQQRQEQFQRRVKMLDALDRFPKHVKVRVYIWCEQEKYCFCHEFTRFCMNKSHLDNHKHIYAYIMCINVCFFLLLLLFCKK